jgi:atlastin
MTEAHKHPHGRPESVFNFSAKGDVVVDVKTLRRMLQHEDVKERQVVAFSVVGAFRRGKSFLLDYCLRFLYAHVSHLPRPCAPLTH